jgi:hypothetical protein
VFSVKKVIVLIAALALFVTSVAVAAEPGPKFEQNRLKHLQNLDAKIIKDMDLKVCFEKSMSSADMQTCRGKAPKGKAVAGPKFDKHKAQAIQKLDFRIRQHENRKACIARAANHAEMQACPKVKAGK